MPPEAEDQVDDQVDTNDTDTDDNDDAPQSNPEAERVARLMGWRPESEFKPKREGDKWLPADEFVSEFASRMRNTNKKNRELEGKLQRLEPLVAQLQQKMTAGDRADLRRQARELMEAGEYDKAEELFEKAAAPAASEPAKHPALAAFEERNADWYGVDDEATEYVAFMDAKIAKEAGGVKDADAHMRKVEAAVKRRFPELFGEKKGDDKKDDTPTRRQPLVSRGTRTDAPRDSGKVSANTLTPAQRRAADTMGVSYKDYAEQLNNMNGAA